MASVFDIEATSFKVEEEKRCCMYAWVFGINGLCIRGRTWLEFFEVIDKLIKHYNISLKKRLIIYIHNESYEFQWINKYFEWEKVFSLDSRKPLYAVTKHGIEFRCSYLLSGYSLEKLGDNLTKYKTRKKVGDLDYKLLRHSKTPLTEQEWGYILNDGLVVMAHIQEEIERLGDITKLPLTKTGYVRDLCRERCLKGNKRWAYSKLMKALVLTPQDYLQLKRAYSGGFTHANVNFVGKVISNVHSFDFASSYPAVMLAEKFPMSKPKSAVIKSEKDLYEYLDVFCCVFDITFYNICASVDYENYISYSRCSKVENYLLNNGRVIEADMLKITITEQDFFIITQMYEWDSVKIENFHYMYKAYLPKEIILTILDLYQDKVELKGIEEKIVEYLVSKGMINALYGMCVTDPCRDEEIYDGDWRTKKADIVTQIEKYNNSQSRFLYYPWGVWVTAYARRNLFSGILEFKDDYIYSDTDSVKVINIEKHKDYIESYNKRIEEKVVACLEYYDIPIERCKPKNKKGNEMLIGIWDYEGMYSRFKTLGAKRYLYEKDEEMHITVAGVSKDKGMKYLRYTYKTNDKIFANFEDDLYFPPEYAIQHENGTIEYENGSGKMCHTYIDYEMKGTLTDYLGNVGEYHEMGGVHLENTDYTLGLDAMFLKLILGIKEGHICG